VQSRGFWTRIVVFGASLLVFVGAVLVMFRERSLTGVALTSLLALLSLTRIIGAGRFRARRSPPASTRTRHIGGPRWGRERSATGGQQRTTSVNSRPGRAVAGLSQQIREAPDQHS
jgi:hypothetical protein